MDDFRITDRPGSPVGATRKTAIERRHYTFDYSNWLGDSEKVTNFDVHVVPQDVPVAEQPIDMTVDTVVISTDGFTGSLYANDGMKGGLYALQLIAKTSINRMKEDGLLVEVVPDIDENWGMTCDCGLGVSNAFPQPEPPANEATPFTEQLTVTGIGTLSPLKYVAWDSATSMELVVNGRVFPGCVKNPAFTVLGKIVTWVSPIWGLSPGDEVVARYRYVTSPATAQDVHVGTLYYYAAQGQKVFPLSVPDRFGHTWMLDPTIAVNISRNGMRIQPVDPQGKGGFTVAGNSVTLVYPAGQDETITVDMYGPGPAAVQPSVLQKNQTLYYRAAAAQTVFPLGAGDLFGHRATLIDGMAVTVMVSGSRLTPGGVAGVGDYVADFPGNKITLYRPAGVDEIMAIDLFNTSSF